MRAPSLLLLAAIVLLPLWPLAQPARYAFDDWNNHVWLVAWQGEYLRLYWDLPSALFSNRALGMMHASFYSPILYPVLALFAALFRADRVMQTAVVGFSALLALATFVTAARLRLGRARALVLTVIVQWEIYRWTNLYNRNALAEHFAVLLLQILAGLLYLSAHEEDRAWRRRWPWILAPLWALMVGTHAITAVFGTIALALGALLLLPRLRTSLFARAALAPAAFALALVAPWGWAMARFGGGFRIVRENLGFRFLPGVDALGVRLWPLPYDGRTLDGITGVSTPYLDAQVSLPLLALWGVTVLPRLRRCERGALVVSLAAIGAFALALLWSAGTIPAPPPLRLMQFAYRLVPYANVCLFVAVLSGWHGTRGEKTPMPTLALGVALALAGVAIKLRHVPLGGHGMAPVPTAYDFKRSAGLVRAPRDFFSSVDYANGEGVRELTSAEWRRIGFAGVHELGTPELGRVGELDREFPRDGTVLTDAIAFPWIGLELDGAIVPRARLVHYWGHLGIADLARGRHRLRLVFAPPAAWRWAHRLAPLLWLAWALALVINAARLSRLWTHRVSWPSFPIRGGGHDASVLGDWVGLGGGDRAGDDPAGRAGG